VKTLSRIAILPLRGQCLNTVERGTQGDPTCSRKTNNLGPVRRWAYECRLSLKERMAWTSPFKSW
jgi:hypothetical protein